MKLDNEQDRQVLLGLIQSAQISGAAVMIVADLVQRIQSAEIEVEYAPDEKGNVMPKAAREGLKKNAPAS